MPRTRKMTTRKALKETLWMARRYATGRSSAAVSIYNDTLADLLEAGYTFKDLGLRPDDMPGDYSGLSVWARDMNFDWPWDYIDKYGGHEPAEFNLQHYKTTEFLPRRAYIRNLEDAPMYIKAILDKFPPTNNCCHQASKGDGFYWYDFNQSWDGAHQTIEFRQLG